MTSCSSWGTSTFMTFYFARCSMHAKVEGFGTHFSSDSWDSELPFFPLCLICRFFNHHQIMTLYIWYEGLSAIAKHAKRCNFMTLYFSRCSMHAKAEFFGTHFSMDSWYSESSFLHFVWYEDFLAITKYAKRCNFMTLSILQGAQCKQKWSFYYYCIIVY